MFLEGELFVDEFKLYLRQLGFSFLNILYIYNKHTFILKLCKLFYLSVLMHLACACLPDGSDSSLCDSSTGQCSCLPGVNGQRCEQCMVGNTETH